MISNYDRREYARFAVENKKIVFFVDGTEFTGDILDVSENGFKIKVYSKLPESKKFSYQFFYNSINGENNNEMFIVNGNGYFVRNESDDVVGCRVQSNEELSKFVRQIIIELYRNHEK